MLSELFVHLAPSSWSSQLQADTEGDHIPNTGFCQCYLPSTAQGEDLCSLGRTRAELKGTSIAVWLQLGAAFLHMETIPDVHNTQLFFF